MNIIKEISKFSIEVAKAIVFIFTIVKTEILLLDILVHIIKIPIIGISNKSNSIIK